MILRDATGKQHEWSHDHQQVVELKCPVTDPSWLCLECGTVFEPGATGEPGDPREWSIPAVMMLRDELARRVVMANHHWVYQQHLEGTRSSRHVGGFVRCKRCGLFRFSRPHVPGRPGVFYAAPAVVLANLTNTVVTFDSPHATSVRPECVTKPATNGGQQRLPGA